MKKLQRSLALFICTMVLIQNALAIPVFAFAITTIETKDTDKNGQIDKLKIRFDQDLDRLTAVPSDFSLSGGFVPSSLSYSGNLRVAELLLIESGTPDTGAAITTTVVGGAMDDTLANPILASSTASTDDANPIVLSLTTTTITGSYPAGTIIPVTATFSEPVVSGNVTLNFNNGGSVIMTASGANTATGNYTVLAGEDTPLLTVSSSSETTKDATGNNTEDTLPVFASGVNIAIDTIAPMLSTISPNGGLTNNTPILFSFAFSEDVTGFDATDVTVTNGAKGTFSTIDAQNYTLQVIPTIGNSVAVGVSVATGTFQDAAGNLNTAGNSASVTSDTQLPSLTSVTISSENNNPAWAKENDKVTYKLFFDEPIKRSALGSATSANNASTLHREFDQATFDTKDKIVFKVQNGDNGDITILNANFTVIDQAGNTKAINAGTINALVPTPIKADTTKPTIPAISIASNNALDTTLAKTNDTITVTFTTADNLSTNITRGSKANNTILNKKMTSSSVSGVGAGQTISRFTNGNETSEVIVPFKIKIKDEAGNKRTETAVTDGSSVTFDRTNPTVTKVEISATSQDTTAYLGDVPDYYAKQGDTLDFQLDVCDFVDSLNNPPTGTIFGTAVTLDDAGLVGGPCTTPKGNPSTYRRWTKQLTNINGTEGIIPFDIDVKDEAGNILADVTGTTNSSSVFFDKTNPTNPTTILDLDGPETTFYKYTKKASYTWSGQSDAGSGIIEYRNNFSHPSNGTNIDVVIPHPTATYTPPEPVAHDDPYTLAITVRDKAGNDSTPAAKYVQKYSLAMSGKVTDENGKAIENASVQIVADFGDTCNNGSDTCGAITDENGEYFIVVQPNRTFNVSFWETLHYLAKQDVTTTNVDIIANAQLQTITSPHEIQTGNQGVTILTDLAFQPIGGNKFFTTEITAFALDGSISVEKVDSNTFIIRSNSRITTVTSNNPNVSISGGGNMFTISNGGSPTQTVSHALTSQNGISTSQGAARNVASGNTRTGIVYRSGGTNSGRFPGMAREDYAAQQEYMTYQESRDQIAMLNQGFPAKVKSYVNRNGYVVFGGYQSGRIGLDRFPHRFQNQIVFRGGRASWEKAHIQEVVTTSGKIIQKRILNETLSEKTARMKSTYQVAKEKVKKDKSQIAGMRKLTSNDVIHSVMSKKIQEKSKVNKFARIRSNAPENRSRITGKDQSVIRLKGTNVSMAQMFSQ